MQTNRTVFIEDVRRKRRGVSALLALAAVCAALAGGCARSTVTTTINPNGSWVRQDAFHATASDEKGFNLGVKLEDVFFLPSGVTWKVTRAKKGDEVAYTAERTLQAGETLKQDIAWKGEDKAAQTSALGNEVTVRQVAPGRYEYREVLHWQGKLPKEVTELDPQLLAAVKGALPPALATDANAKETAQIVNREFLRMLFGPRDPMMISFFAQILMSPDLMERRVMSRIGGAVSKALEEKFGAQLPPEERRAVAIKIMTAAFNSAQTKVKSQAKPEAAAGANSAPSPSLTFIVKMPGKIVDTNGEVDEFTGEVYWSFYPQAAALGDVILTATCDVNK
ncbi:MAG TPA: hypothetical protein VFB38_02790 [Chthonomonadaceae bacterium]|nr:hypothetical protein [Chthonomonadaceae bacterium]